MDELKINDRGESNVFEIAAPHIVQNSSITVAGRNNRVVIGEKCWLRGWHLDIACNDCLVIVGADAKLTGRWIMKLTDGGRIEIGDGTSVGGASLICGEGRTIRIGRDCMLAWGIEIRTTDSHGIYELDGDRRINPGADVVLGDHVWVAAHAVLLKGAKVPDGSVVALRAVVTKAFEEPNVVLSGLPAAILRRGVRWERPLLG